MSRPDKQLNDVIFWKDFAFAALTELTSRDNAYFQGVEQVVLFLKSTRAGTLDIDMEIEGSWEEIVAGTATVIGMNVIRIEHALYKEGRMRLRWTPGAQPGTITVVASGFPRGAVGPAFKMNDPSSIHT
jgi:hypothetical protein